MAATFTFALTVEVKCHKVQGQFPFGYSELNKKPMVTELRTMKEKWDAKVLVNAHNI